MDFTGASVIYVTYFFLLLCVWIVFFFLPLVMSDIWWSINSAENSKKKEMASSASHMRSSYKLCWPFKRRWLGIVVSGESKFYSVA